MKRMVMLLAALVLLSACGSQTAQETMDASTASFGVEEASAERIVPEISEAPITDTAPQEPTQAGPSPAPLPETDEASEMSSEPVESTTSEVEETEYPYIEVDGQRFSITLAGNETAAAFQALLPETWEMEELHGNEKYIYLDVSLPADSQAVGYIEAGDLMLYGDSCVVLFYDSFSTSYGYTRIGWVDDPEGLAEAVGSGDVTVAFRLA